MHYDMPVSDLKILYIVFYVLCFKNKKLFCVN